MSILTIPDQRLDKTALQQDLWHDDGLSRLAGVLHRCNQNRLHNTLRRQLRSALADGRRQGRRRRRWGRRRWRAGAITTTVTSCNVYCLSTSQTFKHRKRKELRRRIAVIIHVDIFLVHEQSKLSRAENTMLSLSCLCCRKNPINHTRKLRLLPVTTTLNVNSGTSSIKDANNRIRTMITSPHTSK